MSSRRLPLIVTLASLTLTLAASVTPRPAAAQAQLSEAERKATARTLFAQGVKEQDNGQHAAALSLFQKAQNLFDAPTHLLHIAQCQIVLGKLVEAAETYETLKRVQLAPGAPEVFEAAKAKAEAELPALRARIPTLRVDLTPKPADLKDLQLVVNDVLIPAELVGIARPVNPGPTKLVAKAQGYKDAELEVSLKEKEQRSVGLALVPGQSSLPAVVVARAGGPQDSPKDPHYVPDKPAPKEPGVRITLSYSPNIPLNKNNDLSFGVVEHNIGAEFIFGNGIFRYHLFAGFSAAESVKGVRFEPVTFGAAIPVMKRQGLRVEVEPTFQLLNLNVLGATGSAIAAVSAGGDIRVNVAVGKLFLGFAPVGVDVRWAAAGSGPGFAGAGIGAGVDFRPRVLIGIEL
ncbi:MAG TPA: hypothetical protein PLR99_13385 [Polyangiaceae bacterium]|nr:hypothetical protein [Polyangiaceae bacterium]